MKSLGTASYWLPVALSVYQLGCALPPTLASPGPIEPAIVEPDSVRSARAFEETLAERYGTLPPTGTAWFEVREGAAPIIISAPHATRPTREGKLREIVDAGTGSLAVMLHELAGATVIFTTYASPSDPNYYDSNEYKETLRKLVEAHRPVVVLDLHASDPYRPYDVDLGTMHRASLLGSDDLLDGLVAGLRREGLINLSFDRFSASKSATVTKWVSSLGTPCIQLEISSTWTDPTSTDDLHVHRYAELLQALVRFARDVKHR